MTTQGVAAGSARGDRKGIGWDDALGGWVVTSHPWAETVLRDSRTFTVDDPRFSTARLTGPSMLTLDGAEHTRHRQAFAAAFRAGAVRERLTAFVDDLADRLVRERRNPDELEVRRELAQPLAVESLRESLALHSLSTAELARWYAELAAAFAVDQPGLPRAAVVAEMRDRLAPLPRPADLTLDEYVGNLAIMLLGGIETVEGMILHAVEHRYTEPTQPVDLTAFVDESLRRKPPVIRLDRYATADTVIGGRQIAAGDLVVLAIDAAGLDPAVFVQPLRFDPARPNVTRHLAFAVGPHYCLGVHLARLEALAALRALGTHLPHARIDLDRTDPSSGAIFVKPERLTLVV